MKKNPLSLAMLTLAGLVLVAPTANAATAAKTKVVKTVKTVKKTVTEAEPATVSVADTTGSTLPVVTAEPELTETSYPKLSSVSFSGTTLGDNMGNLPAPALSVSNAVFLPTVLVPRTNNSNDKIDMSVVDDFITTAMPMARHYPPVFPNKSVRYFTTQKLKALVAWIDPYAKAPNASYDVLLRAAKLNVMGRNLDLGSDYAIRGGDYIARAIKNNSTGEANFLYGMMLTEGGGFQEGQKYLDKAASLGYEEAYQSMAQSDLLNDKKSQAIQRLNDFKAKYPNNPLIDRQIALVNAGKYYIWDLPAVTTP